MVLRLGLVLVVYRLDELGDLGLNVGNFTSNGLMEHRVGVALDFSKQIINFA